MAVCISTCAKFVLTISIATVVYKARKVGPADESSHYKHKGRKPSLGWFLALFDLSLFHKLAGMYVYPVPFQLQE